MTVKIGSVVIADGDSKARGLVSQALQRSGYETIEVGTGSEALEAAHRDGVALVLLEIDLPDITGYEVCRELRDEAGDELPIFFLSGTRAESRDRIAGLLLGADDFIAKPFDPNELVARVRRFVARRASTRSRGANGTGTYRASLTPREREVLALLAEGHSQNQIALDLSISSKTVATHIQHLLGKLSTHSRAALVARAYQLGLVGVDNGRTTA